MTRRVVVTGLGTVNPIAQNVSDYWRGLLAGHSGIAPITQFDTTAFKVHFGGEVKDWKPETFLPPKQARHLDRFAQFAMVAAKQAIAECGLAFDKEDPFRCGVMIGSGIGGMNEFEEQHKRCHRRRAAPHQSVHHSQDDRQFGLGHDLHRIRPDGPEHRRFDGLFVRRPRHQRCFSRDQVGHGRRYGDRRIGSGHHHDGPRRFHFVQGAFNAE